MAYIDPNAPPGPVGFGPGFWRWDAFGGQWRNDWENGGTLLSGENGTPGPAGANAAAGPNFQANPGGHQQTSPHFNSALAAAYAAQYPSVGTEFLGPGEGGLNPSFNPDIALLAGLPVQYGWRYGAGGPSPVAASSGIAPGNVGPVASGAVPSPSVASNDPVAGGPGPPGLNTQSALAQAWARTNVASALDILAKAGGTLKKRPRLPGLGY